MAEVPHWGVELEGRPAVWLKGSDVVEVVGESRCQEHLTRLAAAAAPGARNVEASAWLVIEQERPGAVAVWIGGGLVGHMAEAHALAWQPALAALSARYGRSVACFAKILGGGKPRADAEGGFYAVRLFLPPPPL